MIKQNVLKFVSDTPEWFRTLLGVILLVIVVAMLGASSGCSSQGMAQPTPSIATFVSVLSEDFPSADGPVTWGLALQRYK